MEIRVSAVIMAHPKRSHFIPELRERLDRPVEVVLDQRNDRWHTGSRAWRAGDTTASHTLVLQDDAVIPRDLVAGLERALQRPPPGSPVSLYLGKRRPLSGMVQAVVDRTTAATSWVTMELHWGVGIVLPTELIGPCIAWGDGRPDITNYDMRISRWLRHEKITMWYPWPSLVDHRASPSLISGRGFAGRKAHRFIGAKASALDFDPTGGVVDFSDPFTHKPGSRRWRVTGHCAHASVVTQAGRSPQLFFRGAYLPPDVPEHEVRHLLSVGLIAPEITPSEPEVAGGADG